MSGRHMRDKATRRIPPICVAVQVVRHRCAALQNPVCPCLHTNVLPHDAELDFCSKSAVESCSEEVVSAPQVQLCGLQDQASSHAC
jgi:hypothetical protein